MKGPRNRGSQTRVIATTAIVVFVAYLLWRTATVSFTNPAAVLFLALEWFGGLSFVLFAGATWDTETAEVAAPKSTSDDKLAIFITTYNEDEHVLLPTVAAAVALRPAHETWVLDDGNRPWVKELAEQIGAVYVAREHNAHAKAGNINEALVSCQADLIGFLDADHIPSESFLTNTIGYFDDPSIALVQTPQDFYNGESFEHIGDFCEEQLFYRVIQPGKNKWGGAFWCGTSAVVRTNALRSVGGVATDSVTEDLLTTIRFHARGWHTVFHNEVLAKGLAPTTYTEYLVQRRRWASGAMQILRSKENPLIAKGLNPKQRLAHLTSLSGWFEGVRTIGYILLALLVVFTNAAPVQNSLLTFLAFHITATALSQVAMRRLGQGHHTFFPSLLFDYLRIPATLTAVSQLVGNGRLAFQVTPKGRASAEVTEERSIPPAPPSLLLFLALSQLGWIFFILRGLQIVPGNNGRQGTISALVLLANSVIIAVALKRIRQGHFGDERRRARRFTRELQVLVDNRPFLLSRPSTSGGFIEGSPRAGRQQISVLTREGPTYIDCWVAKHDGQGCTVEFVPGQWSDRARLARSMYLEALPVAQQDTIVEEPSVQYPLPVERPTAPPRHRVGDYPPPSAETRYEQPAHRNPSA